MKENDSIKLPGKTVRIIIYLIFTSIFVFSTAAIFLINWFFIVFSITSAIMAYIIIPLDKWEEKRHNLGVFFNRVDDSKYGHVLKWLDKLIAVVFFGVITYGIYLAFAT